MQKAIGAHGLWKCHLRAAIDTGKSEFTVADVAVDNKCEFGKWLYSVSDSSAQSKSHHENVRRLHGAFHLEVAKILSQALAGQRNEALTAMGLGTTYSVCSADLTREMMEWSRTAK